MVIVNLKNGVTQELAVEALLFDNRDYGYYPGAIQEPLTSLIPGLVKARCQQRRSSVYVSGTQHIFRERQQLWMLMPAAPGKVNLQPISETGSYAAETHLS
jgi:hypothetical protein